MLAVRWAEFVDYVCDAVPGVNPWVTILGMGLVLVLTVWTIIEMLDSLRQGFVKRVGWIPALALSTLLAGEAPSSSPTLDDKEQNRAYVAQVAEERRVVGGMLVGGDDASWFPSGSAGSREGNFPDPLRGDAFASTNTPMTLTGEDVARGYRLESVTTNYGPFAEMPSNAEVYARWSLRGGRKTRFTLDLGDAAFPLGTDLVHKVSVLSGGTLETLRPNAPGSICAAREWASLVPGVSAFWSVDAPDGAKVARWDRVFAERDRSGEYTAEIRLFGSGDFITRSNEVVKTYRRVNPDDWDGDGIANEIDISPMGYDGDFFGTPNALPTNANPNAYYWLDMSVTGRLGVATVRVTCDGPSDLGDHLVIVRTNDVCHVPLLAGATYAVESDLPIADASVSSEYASIETISDSQLAVSLPLKLEFERVPTRGGSDVYVAHTTPIDVGPRIASVSGGCCSCMANENGFAWSCSDECHCGGRWHDIFATATWGGYTRLFDWLGWCPCVWHGESTQNGQSPCLVLNMPRSLFTNNNGGAEDSDIVCLTAGLFSPVATNGTLTLDVGLGQFVKVWEGSNRVGLVTSSVTWNVSDHPCRRFYVEGAEEIERGIDCFSLTWKDEQGNTVLSTNIDFAVYYPKVNVINNTLFDSGDLCNPSGIVTGTNSCFAIEFGAVHPEPGEIKWSIAEGSAHFVGADVGERVRIAPDVSGQRVRLRVQIDDCRSRQPEIAAYAVEPLAVKLTVWIVGDDYGTYYATDPSSVSNLVAGVNKIYEQIGVSFYVDVIAYTNQSKWLDIRDKVTMKCEKAKRRELVNVEKNTGGLELYFVDYVDAQAVANHDVFGIVVSKRGDAVVVAHEIGHAFGCADVYSSLSDDEGTPLPDSAVRQSRLPMDWSNGMGCRYYAPGVSQETIIGRLLMCGVKGPGQIDLSAGTIYGFSKYGEDGMIDVGFFRSGGRRAITLHR